MELNFFLFSKEEESTKKRTGPMILYYKSRKQIQFILEHVLVYMRDHSILGQYVLSDPYVVVHLFSPASSTQCTLLCVLAKQVYHNIRVTNNTQP